MKPSEKQIEFINEVLNQISFFKSTNDIFSPTHWSDNEQTAQAIIEQFWGWEKPPQIFITDLNIIFDKILFLTRSIK